MTLQITHHGGGISQEGENSALINIDLSRSEERGGRGVVDGRWGSKRFRVPLIKSNWKKSIET